MWYLKWRGYVEEQWQGHCPYCDADTFPFLLKWVANRPVDHTKKDFKNVLGYSTDGSKGPEKDCIILLECPECFEKSYFHIGKWWVEKYKKWMKDIDA
jgi:hypothetical protein